MAIRVAQGARHINGSTHETSVGPIVNHVVSVPLTSYGSRTTAMSTHFGPRDLWFTPEYYHGSRLCISSQPHTYF
jgi:hypothetical protein